MSVWQDIRENVARNHRIVSSGYERVLQRSVHIGRCATQPCYNGGTCMEGPFTSQCRCPNPFKGQRCEVISGSYCKSRNRLLSFLISAWLLLDEFSLAPCDSNPCMNGGTCSAVGNTFSCSCLPGYSGRSCESNLRPGTIEQLFTSPFEPLCLAVCEINCAPGYCFSNPSSQPPFACYCPDGTIQLRTCRPWANVSVLSSEEIKTLLIIVIISRSDFCVSN